MKRWLLTCCIAAALAACGTVSPSPTITATPSHTFTPTSTSSRTQTATSQPTWTFKPTDTFTPTMTAIPAKTYPPGTFNGWKQIDFEGVSLKVPATYYAHPNTFSLLMLDIANSRAAFDGWMQGIPSKNRLLLNVMWFNLDRRVDPFSDSSPLISVEAALQKTINSFAGVYSTENEYTVVPYQNVMLGETRAARAESSPNEMIYYFILAPDGSDRYLRIIVQPWDSTMLDIADQILSTFMFTK